MCGRYTLTMPVDSIRELFDLKVRSDLTGRYNLAPGQDITALYLNKDGEFQLTTQNWGLLPNWARDLKSTKRMINARSETIENKPYFRQAFQRRRCLIPADGFYEWKKVTNQIKQPYYIRLNGGIPFCFAGIWEKFTSRDHGPLETCAILTTEATPELNLIHHRMPVILPRINYETWLTGNVKNVRPLLVSFNGKTENWPVSNLVNNIQNDMPELKDKIKLEVLKKPNPTQLKLL